MEPFLFWVTCYFGVGLAFIALVLTMDYFDGDDLRLGDLPLVAIAWVAWPFFTIGYVAGRASRYSSTVLIKGRKRA
jgi:hypothetical protein